METAYFAFNEKFPAPHAGYVHVNEITKNIAKCGLRVTAYVKSSEKSLSSDKKENNRTIKHVKFPFMSKTDILTDLFHFPSSYRKVSKDIGKYDLIHERFSPLNIWSLYILRDIEVPYILEVNSPLVEEIKNRLLESLAREIRELQFEKSDAIITQTNTLKKILSNFTDTPILVVPNGVDVRKFTPSKFSEKVRKKYGGYDEFLITFVGAFKGWHGVNRIPKIAKEVLDKHSNAKFLLVGGGPMYEDVERLSWKLQNRIVLTGPVKNEKIPGILASSDILIAPFDASGYKILEKFGFWWCPVKLFEYMASGRPIVSYDFEEVRNIVDGAGLLAQPGNQEEFIENLCTLIEDEGLRKRLGKKGRKMAVEKHDWSDRSRKIIEIYEKFV